MYLLLYTNLVRGQDKFFHIREDVTKLIKRANELAKQERYIIRWNKSKRKADITLRGYPTVPVGRFRITREKPL